MSIAEHGNVAYLDHEVVVAPTVRQAKRRSIEKAEKAKAGGNAPDMPTSARSGMARTYVEPPQTGKSK